MGERIVKLPDVGEGVAEAELVEWGVAVGDMVREDAVLASVMTDKATVEIPSPADGKVVWLGGEIGEKLAVGSPLVRIEVAGEGDAPEAEVEEGDSKTAAAEPGAPEKPGPSRRPSGPPQDEVFPLNQQDGPRAEEAAPAAVSKREAGPARRTGGRPLASPAVRQRARDAGIDLRQVQGSGPAGRIGHGDLDAFLEAGPEAAVAPGLRPDHSVREVKIVGLRRRIAERMALAKSRIPHITYVEEVDVTALEELRDRLNASRGDRGPKLTVLPFLMRAMVRAIGEQPMVNAHFDDEAGIVHQYGGVHVGVATQTPRGLVVPVVRHAEARDLWGCAAEIARLAEAARAGTASGEELAGSTITITSLGALGGLVTTPIINRPEVAIVGVNKIQVRPMWDGHAFQPRKMMNLSSGFDHRVVDGWDAAVFVQRVKALLETPAMIFV